MTANCDCEACRNLAAEIGDDHQLFRFYRRKLLIRGWAGRKTPAEKAYILAHAEWAQAAVRAGAATRLTAPAHLSNGGAQTQSPGGVVVEDLEAATAPPGA